MAQFGDKAYMLLQSGKKLVGIAGWQVENLVVRTTDLYLEPDIDVAKALEKLIHEIEQVSSDLQCEASLVFPSSQPGRSKPQSGRSWAMRAGRRRRWECRPGRMRQKSRCPRTPCYSSSNCAGTASCVRSRRHPEAQPG